MQTEVDRIYKLLGLYIHQIQIHLYNDSGVGRSISEEERFGVFTVFFKQLLP